MNHFLGGSVHTRDRILRISARLFCEKGYDGVSIRDIVSATGVNLGAVNYHFGGKEGLFAAVIAREAEPLMKKGREIVALSASPETKLRMLLEAWGYELMHRNPGLRLMIAEATAGGNRLPKQALDGMRWRNRVFGEIVKEGIRAGIFRNCDIETAAWAFFGMLSAYILYRPLVKAAGRSGRYAESYVKRVVNSAFDLFMNGLVAKRSGKIQAASDRR